eukprot:TRINITY_DN6460_c0_g1_i4.p1 TRINITY_DN6460_c0_g1~~TRINITY_DN6460_c0_g1_i4.p1  ORF type:complete len:217 (-),score=65.75 TRINITY_DN6460_c0_g1_i4:347-949(-)
MANVPFSLVHYNLYHFPKKEAMKNVNLWINHRQQQDDEKDDIIRLMLAQGVKRGKISKSGLAAVIVGYLKVKIGKARNIPSFFSRKSPTFQAEIVFNKISYPTKLARKEVEPDWGEEFVLGIIEKEESQSLKISIYDHDLLRPRQEICSKVLYIHEIISNYEENSLKREVMDLSPAISKKKIDTTSPPELSLSFIYRKAQ